MNLKPVLFTLIALLIPIVAWANDVDYNPPANYYNGATGTGATLKSQLTTIMSTGQILRSYGDFRYSAAITDADPNTPGNILLVYSRASVPATWDSGVTWAREHTWPDSRSPGTYSNSTTGQKADPHMLRPINPSINSSRSNKPFGWDTSTGSYGAVASGYWYPGDADKGDMARAMFYEDTRWTSTGISLTDATPSGYQMGDLSSLVAWNYIDVPDEFERRRNQAVYSSGLNPSYYTNNRNAYIDHPEYVWSVYVDQLNDSQITIAGGTTDANGSSTRNVDLGRVFVGGAVPAAQNFTLNKGGMDGTYYEVTASGAATSSINGRYNAFRTDMTDSQSIAVGLNTSTASAGLKSGSVSIDNLDITSDYGAGHGAQDGNDQFNVSLDVLDHSTPSFNGGSDVASLVYDFGSVAQGSLGSAFSFDIHNLEATLGYTADLDFDSFAGSGNTGAFVTDFGAWAGSLSLVAGTSHALNVALDTSSLGNYSATYSLSFSDEDLPGALTSGLMLTVLGNVVAVPEPASWLLLASAACTLGLIRRRG
jgi:endonuclease I